MSSHLWESLGSMHLVRERVRLIEVRREGVFGKFYRGLGLFIKNAKPSVKNRRVVGSGTGCIAFMMSS